LGSSGDPSAGKHTKRSRSIAPGGMCRVTTLLLCLPALLLSASMRTAVTPGGTSYSWITSRGSCIRPSFKNSSTRIDARWAESDLVPVRTIFTGLPSFRAAGLGIFETSVWMGYSPMTEAARFSHGCKPIRDVSDGEPPRRAGTEFRRRDAQQPCEMSAHHVLTALRRRAGQADSCQVE
jgi:hypothetical protein